MHFLCNKTAWLKVENSGQTTFSSCALGFGVSQNRSTTHPMFEPVLFRLLLFEDGLDSVGQRGGVGHVQVTGYPDDSCVAIEETLKNPESLIWKIGRNRTARIWHQCRKATVLSCHRYLILLSKMWLFLNLVKHTSKNFYNSKDSKSVLIFTSFSSCWVISNFVIFQLI